MSRARQQQNLLSETQLNYIVQCIRQECKYNASRDFVQVLERFTKSLSESDLALRGIRCSYLVLYLFEGLLFLLGNQFVLSSNTSRAKVLIVDIVESIFSKATERSHLLTDQLVATLAQAAISFRGVDPVDKFDPNLELFSRLASINLSKRLLRKEVLEDLFVICTLDFIQCLVEIIFHYCCVYDTSRKKSVHASVLQCLAVYGDELILEQFYLQEW